MALNMDDLLEQLLGELDAVDRSIERNTALRLLQHLDLVLKANRKTNLTRITEPEEAVTLHIVDSLLLAPYVSGAFADMGSGAGFPGIPLKIAFPALNLCLADSLNKRILFLEEVIRELELTGIRTVHGRAEDLGRDRQYRESFDLVVSRAVANLSSLSEYCLPLVKMQGQMIAYKSTEIDQEIQKAHRAVRILGGEKMTVRTLPLPETDLERSFVIVQKKNPTPARYPRKAGTPARNPL